MTISTKNFRKVLKITSPILASVPANIRLQMAKAVPKQGIKTLFDPNSIRTYSKIRTKTKYKLISIENGARVFLDVNDIIGFRASLNGTWDPTCYEITKLIEPKNLVFIDIGANVGTTLIPIALRKSKVIAFEANPATAGVLLRNVALNRVEDTTVFSYALGAPPDSGKYLSIFSPIGNTGAAHMQQETRSKELNSERYTCLVKTLDETLTFLNFFGDSLKGKEMLIKIDVEGFEAEVFKGAEKTLKTFRPIIIFEFTPLTEIRDEEHAYFWKPWPEYDFYSVKQDLEVKNFEPSNKLENVLAVPREKKYLLPMFRK
jgi:FkbM family methyltransferase